MKKTVFKIILACMVFFVSLLILEVGFRAFSAVMMNYNMEMHKYAKKLKKSSSVPGLTHEHVPGSEAFLMGVDVKINSMGFRSPEIAPAKSNNEKRIMLVGSSITLGWGVPQDKTFAALLENKLRNTDNLNVNVVNTGIGNYNTVMESILFKDKVNSVKPDIVILHYFINDAETIESHANNPLIAKSYLAAFFYVRIKELLYGVQYKSRSIGEYYKDIYASSGWSAAKSAILEMKKICGGKNIAFLVLLQPDLHDLNDGTTLTQIYSQISAFLDSSKIDYLNLFPAYSQKFKTNPKLIWVSQEDSHPNMAGHELISDTLYPYLLKSPVFSRIIFDRTTAKK